ncbi:hypothetical protein Kpol_1028p91 [Vanderwaltozyma polyspora DSM 70294]|uniref:Peptidase M20 dimerisation domain-containing protein n=1 Tax=Vanderwaltozyma polyspora (strain ATCC 22028 / DSM 70294 / BCRC 21397 / CBS 2163 / NBRC 10782 / NRRL Y-8283 / UCD 57-17) TaxID=436907 RepID=A7TG58_VANPO|nr:uncharacterized protein Kpol_1028p91 [Vanderwaltozyma polyspora DSM 70294]EDO18815.1 hypothetical protein Kpol_1028p91 [Vanderwaltozyma polyspora DSM 70294]
MKPNIYYAHQDVVPVDNSTLDEWEYPPFSGYYDGTYVWGRGSLDDKHMIVGMLQSVEYILENEPDFQPNRTLLLAFGADEEISGNYGSAYISEVLYERYGQNGIYSFIDEGGNAVANLNGVWIASPATGEKGFMNLEVTIDYAGGHSSVPPDHTSIGIAAMMINAIEEQLFPPMFTPANPVTEYFQCMAEYSEVLPATLKSDFANAYKSSISNKRVIDYLTKLGGKTFEYLLRTSQAVDVINGGIKANALPESTNFVVNTRIAVESTVNATLTKITANVAEVAQLLNLSLFIDGTRVTNGTTSGRVSINTITTLEPAPVSPENAVWDQFAGTIKSYFEDVAFPGSTNYTDVDLVIAPSIMNANTDSRHYWNLTSNIYRFQPSFMNAKLVANIHSADEHFDADNLMHIFGFFYDYLHVLSSQEE